VGAGEMYERARLSVHRAAGARARIFWPSSRQRSPERESARGQIAGRYLYAYDTFVMRYFDKNVSLGASSPSPWIIRQLPSPQTEKRFVEVRERERERERERGRKAG